MPDEYFDSPEDEETEKLLDDASWLGLTERNVFPAANFRLSLVLDRD